MGDGSNTNRLQLRESGATKERQSVSGTVCHRFSGCYSSFLLSNSLAASLMILISSSSLISETSTGAS